ncbi:MAG: hypothetical protein ACKVZJ_03600 [Phycisphaerales bacterium]
MSEGTTRPRPTSIESQLRAMANATDRANRPTGLLVIGCVVALGFGLYALAAFRGWSAARSSLTLAQADAATVERLIGEHAAEKAKTPDLGTMFPKQAALGTDIEKAARRVWQLAENQPIPGVTIGRPADGTIFSAQVAAVLQLRSVEATIADQPLEKVFGWLAAVESDKFLGSTFVSSLNLNPAGQGWQGSIRFNTYERKIP